jgi:hypothetical protein
MLDISRNFSLGGLPALLAAYPIDPCRLTFTGNEPIFLQGKFQRGLMQKAGAKNMLPAF